MKNVEEGSKISSQARNHMANERTFLAWVRTSVGIMAFGFVVEKFTLFLKQISNFLGKPQPDMSLPHTLYLQGYSSVFGIFLVSLGVLICLLAFIKYKKGEKQIRDDTYQPSMLLSIMLTLFVLLIGVFLVIYLKNSI